MKSDKKAAVAPELSFFDKVCLWDNGWCKVKLNSSQTGHIKTGFCWTCFWKGQVVEQWIVGRQ